MSAVTHITTAEELWRAGDIGRCELVRGEVIMMSPANPEHARVMARLSYLIMTWLDEHPDAGEVWSGDPGFIIQRDPDTVRAPDIALVARHDVERTQTTGFARGAPRLAIEIISPNDAASEVLAKVQDWLNAGTEEVWVVDPQRRTVAISRKDQPVRGLGEKDELTSGSLLPGFRVPVAAVFR